MAYCINRNIFLWQNPIEFPLTDYQLYSIGFFNGNQRETFPKDHEDLLQQLTVLKYNCLFFLKINTHKTSCLRIFTASSFRLNVKLYSSPTGSRIYLNSLQSLLSHFGTVHLGRAYSIIAYTSIGYERTYRKAWVIHVKSFKSVHTVSRGVPAHSRFSEAFCLPSFHSVKTHSIRKSFNLRGAGVSVFSTVHIANPFYHYLRFQRSLCYFFYPFFIL